MGTYLTRRTAEDTLDGPDRKLWAAVLDRAFMDLTKPNICDKPYPPLTLRTMRGRAMTWFELDTDRAGSCAFVCAVLDLPLPTIRRLARDVFEGRRKYPLDDVAWTMRPQRRLRKHQYVFLILTCWKHGVNARRLRTMDGPGDDRRRMRVVRDLAESGLMSSRQIAESCGVSVGAVVEVAA